jgi:hypothetical protein
MGVELRRAVGADAEVCSRIIYEAFKGIADRHGFAPAFPSLEVALRVANLFLGLPTMYGLVAVSLFRWCLDEGLRIEKPLTLMTIGEYHEPHGCYFPSGFY